MKKFSLLVAILTVISSCSDETTIYEDSNDNITLEDNSISLSANVNYDNAGVIDIMNVSSSTGKFTKEAEEYAGDYPLSLVAQIEAPTYSGSENLTATHVTIEDDYAYVSYNTVEDGYVGAIDVIKISDPNSPELTSRLFYSNADINSIAYSNGYIYIAGGVNSESSATATTNSFVAKISVSNGRIDINQGVSYGFQEGYNSTDVTIADNKLLVTSGKEGSLTIYDKNSIEILNEIMYTDLRAVATSDDLTAVLDADSGVKIFDANFNVINEIAISSDFGVNSKRTIDFSEENIIVSEGSNGAGIYNANTGAFVEYIPILINPEGSNSSDNVTNAVAVNEEVILMANGGAGLSLSTEMSDSTNPVGIIDLDGSINFVTSKGDYIFAASGSEGLQIIKMNKPNESLEEKCSDLETYRGSATISVGYNEVEAYQGSKRLSLVSVSGELLLCGTWTVSNNTTINEDGLFEMNGTFIVGNNRNKKNITVGKNATFRIEGDLGIYGDLILEEGAHLEFIGNESLTYITGSVIKAESATIIGEFNDYNNKF
ncbi:hypothetical protein KO500_08035 [Cellulophaga baltica]|uniref:hypothetical protein n=1 Tax=Cellulophaga TaxID=104264 RepID=UPI001C066F18|nr:MULTISPECIES: hypothetical protein [Cellulophaga]MBU2996380.1 hypothetical protein [Cellulophaga baltica]MDO6767776.1 hypothetical protein [Cellulophaga sp. 1_MG-2023]